MLCHLVVVLPPPYPGHQLSLQNEESGEPSNPGREDPFSTDCYKKWDPWGRGEKSAYLLP